MDNRENRTQRKRQWVKYEVIYRGGSQPWNRTWNRKSKSVSGARRVGARALGFHRSPRQRGVFCICILQWLHWTPCLHDYATAFHFNKNNAFTRQYCQGDYCLDEVDILDSRVSRGAMHARTMLNGQLLTFIALYRCHLIHPALYPQSS